MRSERLAVTVDSLIKVVQNESAEAAELTYKGCESLIRRFMDYFKLSVRQTTGTSGFREDQTAENRLAECESVCRRFRQIIVERGREGPRFIGHTVG